MVGSIDAAADLVPQRVINAAATVDAAITNSMFGQWIGWDTATGWMNTVERHGRRHRGETAPPPQQPSRTPQPRADARAPPLQRNATNSRSSTKLRSTLSSLSEGISELTDVASSKLSRASKRRSSREADTQQHDTSDPTTWSDEAVRAYLTSYNPARKPTESEDREDLIRRCCVALGRPYHAPPQQGRDATPPFVLPPPPIQQPSGSSSVGSLGSASGGGGGVSGTSGGGSGAASGHKTSGHQRAFAYICA